MLILWAILAGTVIVPLSIGYLLFTGKILRDDKVEFMHPQVFENYDHMDGVAD